MTNKLSLAVIQANLLWEDIKGNVERFSQKFKEIDGSPHIVVLPEMSTTGFSMNAEKLAEKEDGYTKEWMIRMSNMYGFAICGSYIIKEKNNYFNRFTFVTPQGDVFQYNKRHLFTFANENKKYTSGNERIVFEYLGWRILPQICYDVRFPVWSCNRSDYDLIINVANFPGSRRNIWSTLLRARAIENQCYVAAVNRVGHDGLNINYTGDSQMINAIGEPIVQAAEGEEVVIYGNFDLYELKSFRDSFPVLLDADDFQLNQ